MLQAVLALLAALPALAQQAPFSSPVDPHPLSKTLMDALNADPDYTSLLQLLQRARLIPTLNRLNGSTFFAPTNAAIEKHAFWSAATELLVVPDNIQEQLRQQLFYHLINYEVSEMPEAPNPLVLKTLHYPRSPLEPPSRDPPPSPPWMPVPGGSLGSEPQRLRVAARDQDAFVGVDAFGKTGVSITKGIIDAGNGLLLGIDQVLEPPPNLAHLVSQHASVAYFNQILTPEIRDRLNTSTELTLFLPVDAAFESLHELERLYLESPFATSDLTRILDAHAVIHKTVKYADTFVPTAKLKAVDGSVLDIVVTPERTTISTAELVQPDIYASNGVLHLVSDLLVDLELTPEKYLLALNCSSFVSLIHSVNLTSFINDTESRYTILAPQDSVLSVFGDDDIPERGSEELKKLIQYHFIPGHWDPAQLRDGMLLETALVEEGLNGSSQVLSVSVNSPEKKKDDKTFKFGGVGVLGGPIPINNTLVYFISRPLTPPPPVIDALLPLQDLSMFLASLYSTLVSDTLLRTPQTSLLAPRNSAFKRLGPLVGDYLLAPTAGSKKDLEKVLLHHTLQTVEYSDSLHNGSRTFATLEGSDVQLEHFKNGTVLISPSGGWAGMKAELVTRNILTTSGVLHETSDVLLPRSLELTIGKLVKAAGATTMTTLIAKAEMDWVLNGTAPPAGSIWAEQGLLTTGWTLLCPSDDAFTGVNFTQLYADPLGLRDLVQQHLVPTPDVSEEAVMNSNRPLIMDESASYTTLRSPASSYGDVIFGRTEDGNYTVGIKGARGKNAQSSGAQVLSWGRTTTGAGTGGVILIDHLIAPYYPPWYVEYGGPGFVLVSGLAAICGFFYLVRVWWRKDFAPATFEPRGGFPDEEEG